MRMPTAAARWGSSLAETVASSCASAASYGSVVHAAFGDNQPPLIESTWGAGGMGGPTQWGRSTVFYNEDGSRTVQSTTETSFEDLRRKD